MRTEKEIRLDIEEIVCTAKKEKKNPRISKHLSILSAARLGDLGLITQEKDKLIRELSKLDGIFPEYLRVFVYFRLKDDGKHEKAVRSKFNKEVSYAKKVGKLKVLNYLLGVTDKI